MVVFTLNIHTNCEDWPLCVAIFFHFYDEASKVDHAASFAVDWRWLLAAIFVSAASTLHLCAFEAGVTLSE